MFTGWRVKKLINQADRTLAEHSTAPDPAMEALVQEHYQATLDKLLKQEDGQYHPDALCRVAIFGSRETIEAVQQALNGQEQCLKEALDEPLQQVVAFKDFATPTFIAELQKLGMTDKLIEQAISSNFNGTPAEYARQFENKSGQRYFQSLQVQKEEVDVAPPRGCCLIA